MRKFAARLIKRVENPLHRSRGTDAISFKDGCTEDDVLYMMMLGNSTVGVADGLRGVGDYDEEESAYKIKLRVHSRNLISGETFASAHSTASVTTTYNYSGDNYSFKPRTAVDGTEVLGKDYIRFKGGTRYTLCAKGFFEDGFTETQCIGLAFAYTDGTVEPITVTLTDASFTACVSSAEGKSLSSIAAYADTMLRTTVAMSSFGIFEGVYTSYEDAFSAYSGYEREITVAEPLRRVGYHKDLFDMKAGVVHRWIQYFKTTADTPPIETEYEGIFKFALPSPIFDTSVMQGVFRLVSLEDMKNGTHGICPTEDGNYIYYRSPSGTSDPAAVMEHLESSPVSISYLRAEAKLEDAEVTIDYLEGGTWVEVMTEVSPRSLAAEYI